MDMSKFVLVENLAKERPVKKGVYSLLLYLLFYFLNSLENIERFKKWLYVKLEKIRNINYREIQKT